MSRKPLIRSTTLPYHVTARSNNRELFYCPLDQVWLAFMAAISESQLLFETQTHAFVLMPNHFHLLITTPHQDLGIVMQRMIGSVTKTLNLISGRTGRVFGARYHRTLVDSTNYFACAFKYVYRNPVKAGLCQKVEDYRYSTLHGLLGEAHLPLRIHFPFGESGYWIIPEDALAQLEWLNRPLRKEYEAAIHMGLRRTVFTPPLNEKREQIEFMPELI